MSNLRSTGRRENAPPAGVPYVEQHKIRMQMEYLSRNSKRVSLVVSSILSKALNNSRILLVVVFSLLLNGCLLISHSYDIKQRGNDLEGFYRQIAERINAPELCFKISPKAAHIVSYGVGLPSSSPVYYDRSYCFYTVAKNFADPAYCKYCIPFPNEESITPEKCTDRALKNWRRSDLSGGGLRKPELIMPLLGYTDADARSVREKDIDSNKYNSNNSLRDAYYLLFIYEIENNFSSFIEKLKSLPDFSVSDTNAIKQIQILLPQCTPDNDERICKDVRCSLWRKDGIMPLDCQ